MGDLDAPGMRWKIELTADAFEIEHLARELERVADRLRSDGSVKVSQDHYTGANSVFCLVFREVDRDKFDRNAALWRALADAREGET